MGGDLDEAGHLDFRDVDNLVGRVVGVVPRVVAEGE